jgi:hypothetical protein
VNFTRRSLANTLWLASILTERPAWRARNRAIGGMLGGNSRPTLAYPSTSQFSSTTSWKNSRALDPGRGGSSVRSLSRTIAESVCGKA